MIKLWITIASLVNTNDIKYEMATSINDVQDKMEWIIEDLNQGNLTEEETLDLMLEWEELNKEEDILIKYYKIYFKYSNLYSSRILHYSMFMLYSYKNTC